MATNRKRKRRAAIVAPGKPGIEIAVVDVPDPMEADTTKTIRVMRNITQSPLLRLHGRGRLSGRDGSADAADARFAAGDRLRAVYEASIVGGARAIDYSRVKVDATPVYGVLDDARDKAVREYGRAKEALGAQFMILEAVVCEEIPFMTYADSRAGRYQASGAFRLALYQELRDALDALIMHWRPAIGREYSPIRAWTSADAA